MLQSSHILHLTLESQSALNDQFQESSWSRSRNILGTVQLYFVRNCAHAASPKSSLEMRRTTRISLLLLWGILLLNGGGTEMSWGALLVGWLKRWSVSWTDHLFLWPQWREWKLRDISPPPSNNCWSREWSRKEWAENCRRTLWRIRRGDPGRLRRVPGIVLLQESGAHVLLKGDNVTQLCRAVLSSSQLTMSKYECKVSPVNLLEGFLCVPQFLLRISIRRLHQHQKLMSSA